MHTECANTRGVHQQAVDVANELLVALLSKRTAPNQMPPRWHPVHVRLSHEVAPHCVRHLDVGCYCFACHAFCHLRAGRTLLEGR